MAKSSDEAARAGRYVNQYLVDASYAKLVALCRGVLAHHELADAEIAALVEDSQRWVLRDFLKQLSGIEDGRYGAPTSLPRTRPPPPRLRVPCLLPTGTFAYGPRRQVEHAIKDWGGRAVPTVIQADYLVVGAMVTGVSRYGTHGLKIQAGVEVIERERGLAIVSEAYVEREPVLRMGAEQA